MSATKPLTPRDVDELQTLGTKVEALRTRAEQLAADFEQIPKMARLEGERFRALSSGRPPHPLAVKAIRAAERAPITQTSKAA
jgi:hypothetical protein